MICNLYPEPTFFIFTDGLPPLFYYSHLPTLFVVLFIGFFVYFNNRKELANKLLLFIFLNYSLWVFIDMIGWTNIHSDLLLFVWPWFGISSALISILSIYLVYVFINKNDISILLKTIFTLLLAPLFIFAPTYLNLTGFNITNCDAYGFEGVVYKTYYVALGVLAMIWIPIILLKKFFSADRDLKKQIILFGVGIESFLFIFFSATFLVSYLAGFGILEDSSLESYGLFGMLFFSAFLSILMVKFKAFNTKLIGAQALVATLWFLVGSLLFVAKSTTTQIVSATTLFITTIAGYLLVRSVKKEVRLREEVEGLAQSLAVANEKLKELDKLKSEFVSIASHQLRAPLTAIRGYASMLLDGSFGVIPSEAKEPLDRISESAKNMAYSVEDYLNVSRIESGNMKYNYADFNLRDETEHVCDDLRPQALRKGLVLLFRTDLKSQGVINADVGKTIQIVQNLINNSIKYTEKGSIKVLVRDDVVRKKIYVDIEDTGIGMSEETRVKLFGKFERASNANAVNNSGTGLGLYVAYAMAKGMNGNITAHSEGDGKGSRFTIEFPLAM
jgi:signal transduction histidine kinase